MPQSAKAGGLRKVGDWTLLRNLDEFDEYARERHTLIYSDESPDSYPCFVLTTGTGYEYPSLLYLYLQDLAAMQVIIVGTEDSPDSVKARRNLEQFIKTAAAFEAAVASGEARMPRAGEPF